MSAVKRDCESDYVGNNEETKNERQVTPWTGRQSITGPFVQQKQINLALDNVQQVLIWFHLLLAFQLVADKN